MPSHCGVRALTEKFGGYNLVHVVDVQSSRHDSLDCSIPGLPVPHHLPNLPKSMSTASVKAFRHLILWCPLLLLPSIFPSIRDFSNESAFCISWQNTGVSTSASILPMSIQGWFILRFTGLSSANRIYKAQQAFSLYRLNFLFSILNEHNMSLVRQSVQSLSRVRLLATPWTAAYQAPSMGFSRQEYWSGLPLPSPSHFCIVWT